MFPEEIRLDSNRRTVLKSLGVAAVGLGGLAADRPSSASAAAADGPARVGGAGGGPLEVDEKDMPVEEARCWMINGTDRAVDVYLNGAAEPVVSDVQPLSIGSVLTIDGTVDRPYGTYTIEMRDKGDPGGDVLASASVAMDEGDSFSAVFHRVDAADYQLSVYTNDYSNSKDARVVVRHNAYAQEIDWRFSENEETPEIPDDPRSGTLERGEWQEATDVTEQDYLFEVLVDDQVAAFHVNLEAEIETTYAVHVVGDPQPLSLPDDPPYEESRDGGIDESQWLLVQAFEVNSGDGEPDVVTAPSQPTSTTDSNQPIAFDCEPLEAFETNVVETEIAATDPDGIVSGLAIDHVDPPSDGFTIVDNSVDRAQVAGEPTTATLRVAGDVPPDSYDVHVVANPESLGARATCTIPVQAEPIFVGRIYDLVDQYQLSEDVDQSLATDLNVLLDEAETHLQADETTQACAALQAFLDVVGSHKDSGISESAHDDLQAETQALREDLACG